MTKRKVTVVFGEWGEDTDFTIEPYVEGDEKEHDCGWKKLKRMITDNTQNKETK